MSNVSDSDHRRIEAAVFPGNCIVERHEISDPSRGLRRVPVTKVWRTEGLLGRGGFAEVHLQSQESNKDAKRALKIIPTNGVKLSLADCRRELTAMIEFTKPKYRNAAVFVDFLGWFQNDDAMFLAMEYMPLGDLERNIKDIEKSAILLTKPLLPEEEVQEITRQILEGLKIMHSEGFAHRDLKPQNVFVVQKHPQWWVKLGDFGLSKKRTDGTAFRTQAGTQQYMAPELFYYVQELDTETSEYTNSIDLWSLGCIIFRIVTGAVPFPDLLSLRNYCRDTSKVPLSMPSAMKEAEKFVRGLLIPHPAKRLAASVALESTWLTTKNKPRIVLNDIGAPFATLNLSHSQNNYNTASHKGLQSYYDTSAKNSHSLDPSPTGHISKPLPLLTGNSNSGGTETGLQLDLQKDRKRRVSQGDSGPQSALEVEAPAASRDRSSRYRSASQPTRSPTADQTTEPSNELRPNTQKQASAGGEQETRYWHRRSGPKTVPEPLSPFTALPVGRKQIVPFRNLDGDNKTTHPENIAEVARKTRHPDDILDSHKVQPKVGDPDPTIVTNIDEIALKSARTPNPEMDLPAIRLLPPGWETRYSSNGRLYYFDTVNKVSTWYHPYSSFKATSNESRSSPVPAHKNISRPSISPSRPKPQEAVEIQPLGPNIHQQETYPGKLPEVGRAEHTLNEREGNFPLNYDDFGSTTTNPIQASKGVKTGIPNGQLSFFKNRDLTSFERLFEHFAGKEPTVSFETVGQMLTSGVEKTKWDLANTREIGQLYFPEFLLVVYLLDLLDAGKPLPISLPTNIKNEVSSIVDGIITGMARSAPDIRAALVIQQPQPLPSPGLPLKLANWKDDFGQPHIEVLKPPRQQYTLSQAGSPVSHSKLTETDNASNDSNPKSSNEHASDIPEVHKDSSELKTGESLSKPPSTEQHSNEQPKISRSYYVCIKPLVGETIRVSVTEDQTIEQVKSKLQAQEGYESEHQCLMLAGTELEDSRTLGDYKIQSEQMLHLLMRVGGPVTADRRPSPRIDRSIEIFIELADGAGSRDGGGVFAIQVHRLDTIKQVKENIVSLKDIPVSKQQLHFRGTPLQDEFLVRDYEIRKEDILSLKCDK